ncbi:MAG: 23S rRNA (pseudouridine(1915)-N(3))-methyltransferase RlmH, partial [Clostridia bacterium]
MFSISVICVGKLKERFYADACDEYLKRLSAYANIDVVEVPEASGIHDQLERERAYIAKKLEKGAYIIPLCIEGEMLTSDALADKFNT